MLDDIVFEEEEVKAAAVNEQKRLVNAFSTFNGNAYTFIEWKEKAKKLGCTLSAIRTYWNEAPIVEEGVVTDDSFGNYEEGFSGNRKELKNYLLHNKPELYQRALVVQYKDKELDLTSGAFTDYYIQQALRNYGFEWTIEESWNYVQENSQGAPRKVEFNI